MGRFRVRTQVTVLVAVALMSGVAVTAVPGKTGDQARTPRPVKLRYTLRVSYSGKYLAEVKLGDGKTVSLTRRSSSWKARSVVPFTITRTGSRSKPRYRFSTHVAGAIQHKGAGDTRYLLVMPTGGLGPCFVFSHDSGAQGNTQVHGTFYSDGAIKLKLRFSGYDLRRPLPRVETTYSAHDCPITENGVTKGVIHTPQRVEPCPGSHSGCPVLPDAWVQAVSLKDFKFGRNFTIKRSEDNTVNPTLHQEVTHLTETPDPQLGTAPAGSTSSVDIAYTYVLTFRRASG